MTSFCDVLLVLESPVTMLLLGDFILFFMEIYWNENVLLFFIFELRYYFMQVAVLCSLEMLFNAALLDCIMRSVLDFFLLRY